MSAPSRYTKIGVSVCAWSGVLLVTTYRSHAPMRLGQSSWGYATLLALLVCIAVMAEPLSNYMASFWTKKASHPMHGKRERRVGHAMAEIQTFTMRLAQTLLKARSYFVYLFMSCKRVTRHHISSGSPPY